MKITIFIIGLLSFLIAPISTNAREDLRAEPEPEAWVMSIEVCKDLPPEVQDAVKRGIVFKPWIVMSQQCRWFAIGNYDLMNDRENELQIWPSYQDCMDYNVEIKEGFTLKTRQCQSVEGISN